MLSISKTSVNSVNRGLSVRARRTGSVRVSSVHFPSLIADLAEATAGIGSLRDPVQKSIQEYASAPNALASAQNPAQNFAIQTAINSSTILAFTAIIFGMITYFYATRDAEDVRATLQDQNKLDKQGQRGGGGGARSISKSPTPFTSKSPSPAPRSKSPVTVGGGRTQKAQQSKSGGRK